MKTRGAACTLVLLRSHYAELQCKQRVNTGINRKQRGPYGCKHACSDIFLQYVATHLAETFHERWVTHCWAQMCWFVYWLDCSLLRAVQCLKEATGGAILTGQDESKFNIRFKFPAFVFSLIYAWTKKRTWTYDLEFLEFVQGLLVSWFQFQHLLKICDKRAAFNATNQSLHQYSSSGQWISQMNIFIHYFELPSDLL